MEQLVIERNWAGNHTYRARVIAHPSSVEELQELVASSARIRALGSRHSFNDIADTAGTLAVLSGLDAEISVDAGNMTVTVSGGTRYGTLAAELQSQGFALHNLASLPHISVAGAVSTATHGSGDSNGNLATAVAALDIVTADGTILSARRGDPYFDGMVVGLGALGIISRLTLDIQPTFQVSQSVFERLDWDQVLENFDEVTAAAYSVSLFTDWGGKTVGQAWIKSRAGDRELAQSPAAFFGGTPAPRAMHPLPGVSGSNCTQQLGIPGAWAERLAHFRMEFTPSKGDELQSEYLIPREHAVEAMRTMRRLSDVVTPLLLVSEIRTIEADKLWMSPNYRRDGIGLHFTWRQDEPAVRAVLRLLEAELEPFAARPHWGKLFEAGAASLAPLYPRFGDFIALADRLDPAGKFRNSFLDLTVFGD
ncbi:FAD-binding protein [Pseudarthrobacter psychrotolerans]|uniref:FAD-binding protein n=1 Tax=Pseudarthrobacter psychrotolerans TaxID=2697569 RepID=A0A6P1NPZ3_9MICC|nr:FAD-binding protein [Pseudarthrobacter psychrotolerans]QHK20624.1 FAD-binding protein [Pseudarthrobacter psychrotolerans]